MLAKKPKDRHPSMRAVETALRDEALRQMAEDAITVVSPTPVPPVQPAPKQNQTSQARDTMKTVPIMRVVDPPESSNNRPTVMMNVVDQAGMMDLISKINERVNSSRSVPQVASTRGSLLGRVMSWLRSLLSRLRSLLK
jgi:hypothetical protein